MFDVLLLTQAFISNNWKNRLFQKESFSFIYKQSKRTSLDKVLKNVWYNPSQGDSNTPFGYF